MFTESDRVLSEIHEQSVEQSSIQQTRSRVVDAILALSPNLARESLEGFGHSDLASFLRHLEAASTPRGRMARWVRSSGVPAIVARASRF